MVVQVVQVEQLLAICKAGQVAVAPAGTLVLVVGVATLLLIMV
jgi:hypothetical protein